MSELARVPQREVTDGAAVRVEGGPFGICLVNIGGCFFAISDRCSHAEVSLSEGLVDPDECSVECWKHGSTFSLLDGEPQSLPATKPVPVYSVQVDGDDLVIADKGAE